MLIAAFRCARTFAARLSLSGESLPGDAGGSGRVRNVHPVPSDLKVQRRRTPQTATRHAIPLWAAGHRRACASLAASFAAGVPALVANIKVAARMNYESRRSIRITRSYTDGLIASFRRAAPARCGAFDDKTAWRDRSERLHQP